MIRYYIVPVDSQFGANVRVPKYMKSRVNPTGIDARWGVMDFGLEPTFLMAADVDATQHTLLAAELDVLALPADIDSNLTPGTVTVAQDFMEARNIPANWVTTAFTYRQVLRRVAGLFQFAQGVHGTFGISIFDGGLNLDRTLNSIPVARRNGLQQVADQQGLDYSALGGAATLRDMLLSFAQQWEARPILLGGLPL